VVSHVGVLQGDAMSDIVRDAIAASIASLTQIVRTPTPPLNRGVDLVCIDDLDPRMTETDPDSTESIAQDAYHRITTTRGTMPDDEDYGRDVRQYLSGTADNAAILLAQGDLAREIAKDDRVDDVQVNITVDGARSMRVQIVIEPANPALDSFEMVVTVTDGATLLEIIK
jgi:hypothetical protein